MSEKRRWFLPAVYGLILMIALSCVGNSTIGNRVEPTVMTGAQSVGVGEETSVPTSAPVAPTSTPTSTPVVPTPTPTPGLSPTSPREVLELFYDALMDGRFEEAAGYFTSFSLAWNGTEREDIALYWEQAVFDREWRIVDYKIVEVNEEGDLATARVWAKKEWLENGERRQGTYDHIYILARQADGTWGINYNQMWDVYVCDVPSQDHDGLRIRPLYLMRTWTDTFVGFEAENTSDRPAGWGWVSPEVATVTTVTSEGEKVYSYGQSGLQVMAHRRYPSIYFRLGMPFEGEPVKLVMKEWLWLDETGLPSWEDERWVYEFDLSTGCSRRTATDWSE